MVFYRRILGLALLLYLVCAALPAVTLTLISPTDMQAVREKVTITLDASEVPDDAFLSLYVSSDTIASDNFTVALSPDLAVWNDDTVTFYWDSKSPVRSESNPKEDRYLSDGVYTIRVNAHGPDSRVIEDGTATVKIDLRNKIARPSPAPAVQLLNKLVLNQTNEYDVKATAQVYSNQNTPMLGGVNLAASSSIFQTVDDVWPDGSRLLKYSLGKDTYVTSMGVLTYLYPNPATRPQLYKLVQPTGSVTNKNVFARQRVFSVMDVLPVLPARKVKEGDTWSDKMLFKVDGVTEDLAFSGTAVLDSFEWEQGKQCAKVISNLSSDGKISLLNGRLVSDTGVIKAKVTSYIAYLEGRCIKRDIVIDFPALIQQGLDGGSTGPGMGAPGYGDGPPGGPGGLIGPGMPGPGMQPPMPPMPPMPGGMPGAGPPPPVGPMGALGGGPMPEGLAGAIGGGAPPAGLMGALGGGQGGGLAGALQATGAAMGALMDDDPAAMPGMPPMPGMIGAPGMGMPGMGPGAGSAGMLSLNNAEKGSVQLNVSILLKK